MKSFDVGIEAASEALNEFYVGDSLEGIYYTYFDLNFDNQSSTDPKFDVISSCTFKFTCSFCDTCASTETTRDIVVLGITDSNFAIPYASALSVPVFSTVKHATSSIQTTAQAIDITEIC